MIKIYKKLLTYISLYTFFVYFFFILFLFILGYLNMQTLDPDFGWHLQMGQHIVAKGIPYTDPFSYTMPSYLFVDHEWLTNVIIALVYPYIGILGLSIFFTLLSYLAILLQLPLSSKKWIAIPLLLCIETLSTYIGIRPQIISWLLFSLLLSLLLQKKAWVKIRLLLPLLFLLWVNFHGGFAIGIVVLALYFSIKICKERTMEWIDWVVILLCIVATFCNPYTGRIWGELWMTMADSSLHLSIQEWLPTFFSIHYYLVLLLPLSIFFIFYTRNYFSLFERILYIVLLLFGLLSSRNLPFWIILALPMTIQAIRYSGESIKKIPNATDRFTKVYTMYLLCIIGSIIYQLLFSFIKNKNQEWTSQYPQKAIAYLHKNTTSGNIFSEYEWGGYLIWKLPEKKVFIDGRMPSWQWNNKNKNESTYAFKEFQNIKLEKIPFSQEIKKYHIDTVLLSANKGKQIKLSRLQILFNNLFHQSQLNTLNFPKYLEKAGMHIVYNDSISVIYRKNH